MTGADERSDTAIVVAGGGELVVGDTYEVRHSRKGTFHAYPVVTPCREEE